jgi:hypothetical protein
MSNKFDYLSDEELLRLIDCAEGDGLLSAPHDLKENTLNLICHSEGAQRLKNPEEGSFASLRMTEQKKKNAKKQFYRYCARVALGCAASLAILVSSGPVSQLVKNAPRPETSISQQVNDFSFSLSSALDRVSNAIANYQFGGKPQ